MRRCMEYRTKYNASSDVYEFLCNELDHQHCHRVRSFHMVMTAAAAFSHSNMKQAFLNTRVGTQKLLRASV